MNVGSIAGGTNAGWRTVKQAHKPWKCVCSDSFTDAHETTVYFYRENPGWRGSCNDCGAKRP